MLLDGAKVGVTEEVAGDVGLRAVVDGMERARGAAKIVQRQGQPNLNTADRSVGVLLTIGGQ
jgi:hypothetical protein